MNSQVGASRRSFKVQGGSLIALFLKLAKVLKSAKLLLAGASFATYSLLYTWQFALGLMWAIAIHELGHVWAMRKTGMPTPGFYFVPFFGGAAIGERAQSERQDVFITGMGPTWGLLGALPPAVFYVVTGAPFWATLCGFIGFITLFNLLPIYPLDGGRLTNSIAVSLAPGLQTFALLAAGALVLGLMVYVHFYFIAVLFAIGTFEIVQERKKVASGEIARKPPLGRKDLAAAALWYLALALASLFLIYSVRDIQGAGIVSKLLRDI
jgi:membrane-associated protease RseP (regulator of RpoE activity)